MANKRSTRMTPYEHGAYLASLAPPLSDEQVEAAALFLAGFDAREEARRAAERGGATEVRPVDGM